MSAPYDAIIVLSGGVNDDGSLLINVERRMRLGIDRFNAGDAPILILTGAWGYMLETPPPITEAAAMKQFALSVGVPESAIVTEEEAHDTVGNAYFTKVRILEPREWRRVLVVSSDYHMPRSEFIFRKVLGPSYTMEFIGAVSEPEMREGRDTREAKSLAVHHQWLDVIADGDDASIWQLLSTKHPAYAENPEYSIEQLRKQLYT